MSASCLGFIESNTTGTGRLFALAARSIGVSPLLFTANPDRYGYVSSEGIEVVAVETTNESALLAACRNVNSNRQLVGVASSSEYFVGAAATVARRLGLPGPDPKAVAQIRDKGKQRQLLRAAGVGIPDFCVAECVTEALAAARAIGVPVVVKPVNGSGSNGVRLCRSYKEVEAHAGQLLKQPTNERGLPRPGRILIEQFVEGLEFSVETFGDTVVGVTKKYLGAPPNFVEIGHDFPAEHPEPELRLIRGTTLCALSALGLNWGPAHTELRLSSDGPKIIEVNPRLAGGFIPKLVLHATGVDLILATTLLATGQKMKLEPLHRKHASLRFITICKPGKLVTVSGLDAAREMKEVSDVQLYVELGALLAPRGDFRDRIGHVLATTDTNERAISIAEQALTRIKLLMEPHIYLKTCPGNATENTGRMTQALTPTARRIVFNEHAEDVFLLEMSAIAKVDRAHLVMLVETGIVPKRRVTALLKAIGELEANGFENLRARAAPRGLYLMYENYLSETLGQTVGGTLHTARSRNDLNATVLRERLRLPFTNLVRSALLLQAIVLSRAARYARTIMPGYTHSQPAFPLTYGHYLAGIASALSRDISGFFEAVQDLQTCPLGAGAGGGTTLPINSSRTASLLGFDSTTANSVDAVASRDPVLRLLASATLLGVTISRLATDLLTWLSQEYGFLRLPDRLVGSSSMMPQKRNPFLLEIVQGRTATPLGAFVTAVSAAQKTPFTNSIVVGTEAVRPVWEALQSTIEAVTLTRLVVAGAQPDSEKMRRRTVEGFTLATELANELVRSGTDFRTAHYAVGESVRHSLDQNEPDLAAVAQRLSERGFEITPGNLDPAEVVSKTSYGGGPAAETLQRCLNQCRESWSAAAETLRTIKRKWRTADKSLTETVAALCSD
ncbi:MAG TPA: argininosuccinate lyase [Pyrinomonadaceae bacterium]